MAIQVNPPQFLHRIPKKFLEDPEVRAFIEQQNTIIFQLYNRTGSNVDLVDGSTEGVAENTAAILVNTGLIADNADAILDNADDIFANAGLIADNTIAILDNTDLINENASVINEIPIYSGFMAQVQFLQRQFDGLPEFTIDTTGFTFDSTKITFDKVIA